MNKTPITFIYFDVGMVLDTFLHPSNKDVEEDRDEKWQEVFPNTLTAFDRELCLGEMTLPDLSQSFQATYALPSSFTENPVNYICRRNRPRKEMHTFVNLLRQEYKVGLLTNMYVDLLPQLIKEQIVPPPDWFFAIIDSSVVHTMKPDKEIYELATTAAGVKPAEIAFVDDTLKNVEAARKCGWMAWHFNLENPDLTIKEMATALL